jgi:hypothetical protein
MGVERPRVLGLLRRRHPVGIGDVDELGVLDGLTDELGALGEVHVTSPASAVSVPSAERTVNRPRVMIRGS